MRRQAASAELQALFEQFAKENPARFPPAFRIRIQPLTERYGQSLRHTLYVLFGAVALLLAIGCANTSILLLARGASRRHELGIRAAIGASRARIVRQLLTESLALSLSGAFLGVLLVPHGPAHREVAPPILLSTGKRRSPSTLLCSPFAPHSPS